MIVNVHCNRFNPQNVEIQPNHDTNKNWGIVYECKLNSCYASDAVWVYLHDCVSALIWICCALCESVCVCVCVNKCVRLLAGGSEQNKTKQNEQQNGIIIADILKNKQTQTVQGLWYYSGNKATFSRWVLSCWGIFFSFFSPSSKRFFYRYCFKWQQRGEERDGGRGGVVICEEAFGVSAASTYVPTSERCNRKQMRRSAVI